MIEDIKKRFNAASKGPWHSCSDKCKCTAIFEAPTYNDENSFPNQDQICEVTKGEWGDSYPAIRKVTLSPKQIVEKWAFQDQYLIFGSDVYEAYINMSSYGYVTEHQAMANRDFITNAPADIAWLIARVEELEAKLTDISWEKDQQGHVDRGTGII